MADGLILKCRCGCKSNSKVRGFRELHKFNEHHVKEHIEESDAKALVGKAIANPSWRHCRHCVRNGKMRGFHTHNNMLAHHITEHFDHETQLNIYHAINAEFPWSGGDDGGDGGGDDVDFASVSSRSSIASRYSTGSERSGSGRSTMSLERHFGAWGEPVAPQGAPVASQGAPVAQSNTTQMMDAPGLLSQQEFLSTFGGASPLDYWKYKSDFNIAYRASQQGQKSD
jgi:hypothetical protein